VSPDLADAVLVEHELPSTITKLCVESVGAGLTAP
jgi:hypothetical protein